MSKSALIFIADHSYNAVDDQQLSFVKGDQIQVLKQTELWWWGVHLETRESGWFGPSWGHVITPNSTNESGPVNADTKRNKNNKSITGNSPLVPERTSIANSSSEINANALSLLKNHIDSEVSFFNKIQKFYTLFIDPLRRDSSDFALSFLQEDAIFQTFELFKHLVSESKLFTSQLSDFYQKFSKTGSMSGFQNSYARMDQLYNLYASYTTVLADGLHCVKLYDNDIRKYTADNENTKDIPVEGYLLQPVCHFDAYHKFLRDFITTFTRNTPQYTVINKVISDIAENEAKVHKVVEEEQDKFVLLRLVSEEFGPGDDLYIPKRKFIRSDKIVVELCQEDGTTVDKYYVCHLFNDLITFSQYSGPVLRIKKKFNITSCVLSMEKHGLYLLHTHKDTLRCRSADGPNEGNGNACFIEWEKSMASGKKRRRTSLNMTGSQIRLQIPDKYLLYHPTILESAPATDALGPRGDILYNFCSNSLNNLNTFAVMKHLIFGPLLNLSVARKPKQLFIGGFDNYNIEVTASTLQIKELEKKAKEKGLMEFIDLVHELVIQLTTCMNILEADITRCTWHDDSLKIGEAFNAPSLCKLFKEFVIKSNDAVRTLYGEAFTLYTAEIEGLITEWGKLKFIFSSLTKLPQCFVTLFDDLLKVTDPNHDDIGATKAARNLWNSALQSIDNELKARSNQDKVADIQSSLRTPGKVFNDPIINNLADGKRSFIMEGTLRKVCRKKNKALQFWLFSDLLIYGTPMNNGLFSFNRAIDLTVTNVEEKEDIANSFKIQSKEKSFVVIAATKPERENWVTSMKEAMLKLGNTGVSAGDVAPVWVPDKDSSTCTICFNSFSLFKRRHHCRNCGNVVCAEHSSKRMIVPTVHTRNKQRVCDTCYYSKTGAAEFFVKSTPDDPGTQNKPQLSAIQQQQMNEGIPPPVPKSKPGAITAPSEEITPPIPTSKPVSKQMSSLFPVVTDKDSLTPAPPPPTMPQAPVAMVATINRPVASRKSSVTMPLTQYQAQRPSAPSVVAPPVPVDTELSPNQRPSAPSVVAPPVPTPVSVPAPPRTQAESVKSPPPSPPKQQQAPPPPPAPSSNKNFAPAPPPPPVPPPVVCGDSRYKKYDTMRKMLPEGAVRQKMMVDGFEPSEIDSYFACSGSDGTGTSLPAPPSTARPPPPGPPSTARPPPPGPPPTARPPPPGPPPPVAPAAHSSNPRYNKYDTMRKMLPEGAVRQKMMVDGFEPSEIDSYFGGLDINGGNSTNNAVPPPPPGPPALARPADPTPSPVASLPPPPPPPSNSGEGLMDLIKGGVQLKKTPIQERKNFSSGPDHLQAIKHGNFKLNKVDQDSVENERAEHRRASQAVGMFGMLANAMEDRRKFMDMVNESDEDSDSDGGFDDSDDDD